MALAVLVLTGSGLLLRSMTRVLDVHPGFEARGVLTLQLNVVGQRFNDNNFNWRYYDEVLAAVRAVPGVEIAAFTSQLPLSDDFDQYGVHSERYPAANPADDPSAHRYGVTPGYLETMRIPIVKGRALTPADDGAAKDSAVLVNAAFAKRHFPNEDPIGQRIRIGNHAAGPWRTIVGVTGDIRQVTLAGGVSDAVYHPERQWAYADSPISLVVRTSRDASSIAGDVRRAVQGVDKSQPILRLASMEEMVLRSAGERRFVLRLFEAFALLSAVLAALGMYGVLAASVSERVREIGVREALGATPWNIVGMIVRQAMALAGIGAVAGGVLSAVASEFLTDQLFQTSRGDPVTYAVVLLALGVLALAACAVPAARAARVDPMESLRAE
jgi:putative ABC transport system permease protein